MRKITLFLSLFCGILTSLGAQTTLGGQINSYAEFVSQDACTNTVTVVDATALVPGMGIIILQMQGANIDLSDNSAYGNVTDFNGAGQYEYNRIATVTGNVLTLERTLQHEYSGDATQVVAFSIYDAAEVTTNVLPAPWNGTLGGVIALEVSGTLTLSADLDASGSGFRGGAALSIENNNCTFLTNADDYAYAVDNWRGAPKGEGIGAAAGSEPHGRGAQANGGGGGNDHNSGGGGGGLLTAGGRGGENEEPSTFGCDGEFPGVGGKALPNDGTLAFAGGGGGSGHANNNDPSGGGNGGGIIFIIAETIEFAGGSVRANGLEATTSSGDGGGGGGAGGTVFLIADGLSGTPQVEARGGGGGITNNQGNERCFGPGGGGSGGAFWANQSVTANLDGGDAGMSTNSTACSPGTNGAQNGTDGSSGTLTALPSGEPFTEQVFSVSLNVTDTLVCEGTLLQLTSNIEGATFDLQWQRFVDGTWEDLVEIPGQVTGTQSDLLELQVNSGSADSYRLLLVPGNDCFSPTASEPVDVSVADAPSAAPTFTANGTTVDFLANTINGTAWEWTFLPDQSSNEENPSFTFPSPGTYNVSLAVVNDCGLVGYTLTVTVSEPLSAAIGSSSIQGCAPLTIAFEDQTTGTVASRIWTFPGGDPATSTEPNPVVTFNEVGSYEVMLTVSNGTTESSTSQTIETFVPPTPDFTVISNDLTISLQNNSLNAETYLWDFGDDNTSTEVNPVHTYAAPGVYEVSLNAGNASCGVATAQTVSVTITATNDLDAAPLRIYPNPTTGLLYLDAWQTGQLTLFNTDGRPVHRWQQPTSRIDLGDLPAGVYLMQYREQDVLFWWKIVLTK